MAGVGAEQARAAAVQDALYRIAALASAAQDMQEFYRAIHAIVGELMEARNIFIAVYDGERRQINWPYYVDDVDPERPDPHQWFEFGQGDAQGMSRPTCSGLEKSLHLTPPRSCCRKLVDEGEIEPDRQGCRRPWLGVPLHSAEGRAVGVLAVAVVHTGASTTPSRTRSCSPSWASTSARRSPGRARSRRRGSAMPSWR